MGTAKEQGDIWGARARDWRDCNEPAWKEVFSAVLDEAGVAGGKSYLDLGCGAGGALVLARERGAMVAGLDASHALVRIARERLPGAEIAVGDMEELPFGDESFDAVSGINSFQFTGDQAKAVSEAARVCRKGGTVAVLVWGPREQSDLLSGVMPPVFALLPQPAPGAPQPPQLSEPGRIETLMKEAGLKEAKARDFSSELAFPDLATGVLACLSAAARAIRQAGEDTVRSTLEKSMMPFVMDGGAVRLQNRFHMVTARR